MIWQHFLMRAMVNLRAMSSACVQYPRACFVISSDDHRNLTRDMSMPAAVHTSMRYWPTVRMRSRSPPILSFMRANQSATQKMNVPPACVHLFTFIALNTPCAMCIRPDGSKPS